MRNVIHTETSATFWGNSIFCILFKAQFEDIWLIVIEFGICWVSILQLILYINSVYDMHNVLQHLGSYIPNFASTVAINQHLKILKMKKILWKWIPWNNFEIKTLKWSIAMPSTHLCHYIVFEICRVDLVNPDISVSQVLSSIPIFCIVHVHFVW